MSKWDRFCGEHEQISGYLNLSTPSDACKRELAAFFAHIIYNSNFFDSTSDKNNLQGLYILQETGCQTLPYQSHCLYKDPDAVEIYFDFEGAYYFGRGPLMTKGIRNYYNYGVVTNHDERFRSPQYFNLNPD